jgi:hypothetical protein
MTCPYYPEKTVSKRIKGVFSGYAVSAGGKISFKIIVK